MSELTAKQEAGIIALLHHPTIRAAAREAGVTDRTLTRWLADPVFKRAFRAARCDLVETSMAGLQAATSAAVECLTRNLTCGKPSVEVMAARGIIELAIKAVELHDLAERIETLETALTSRPARGRYL